MDYRLSVNSCENENRDLTYWNYVSEVIEVGRNSGATMFLTTRKCYDLKKVTIGGAENSAENTTLPETGFIVIECERRGCSNENTTVNSVSGQETHVLCNDCAKEYRGVSS